MAVTEGCVDAAFAAGVDKWQIRGATRRTPAVSRATVARACATAPDGTRDVPVLRAASAASRTPSARVGMSARRPYRRWTIRHGRPVASPTFQPFH
jgi:hypothetical protein